MTFLFPSDVLDYKIADESFSLQIQAFKEAGFNTGLFSIENAQIGKKAIWGDIFKGDTIVFRGWMMNQPDYELYTKALLQVGAIPFTDLKTYLSCHHLPNWLELISEYTPKTIVLDKNENLKQTLDELSWESYFIKDYVKSLKTNSGAIISSSEGVDELVSDMNKFRGEIEGGFCIREVENFIDDSELRYFVINGKPYASDPNGFIPDIVRNISGKIESNFYSVDVIKTVEGKDRIVEVGDGQVSDIVGWSAERLVNCWVEQERQRNNL